MIFIVKEKPTIREINYSGNVVYDDEELKENIDSINVKLSPQILHEIEKVHEITPNPAP